MHRPWPLVAAVVAAVVVLAVAVCVAWLTQPSAWNECVAHGEDIRTALEAHRAATGQYPMELDELPDDVPLCREWPGGSILEYHRSSPHTYSLSFSDRLTGHYATEREPFSAHM